MRRYGRDHRERCLRVSFSSVGKTLETRSTTKNLSVVEICAGAGGQSLGLEKAGFSHLAAVELDPDACKTLRANRPEWEVVEGDVLDPTVFDPKRYLGVDLFAGGVPCPPFSIAGKQLGAEDERDLFAFAVHMLAAMDANALLLENVKGLAAPRFAGYREHILDLLQEWGYWAEWRLLRASDFGVPQLRPRFILVALKQEFAPYFSWPQNGPKPKTVGSVLYDLMSAHGWEGAPAWREAAAGIAPTIVGGSKKHGGADLGPTRSKRAWANLSVDAMGLADAAPDRSTSLLHQPRLTNEMVARIQGWIPEDEWSFAGRKTLVYRQIGNAFPPPVAQAVGSQIHKALSKVGEPCQDLQRAEHSDAVVYRALNSAVGRFLSVRSITDRTGKNEEEIIRAISHLESDFTVQSRNVQGKPQYRLLAFKGFTTVPELDAGLAPTLT